MGSGDVVKVLEKAKENKQMNEEDKIIKELRIAILKRMLETVKDNNLPCDVNGLSNVLCNLPIPLDYNE